MRTVYFELKRCGNENVAMTTRFLTLVARIKLLHLYTKFYLTLTNHNLIIAHLNV